MQPWERSVQLVAQPLPCHALLAVLVNHKTGLALLSVVADNSRESKITFKCGTADSTFDSSWTATKAWCEQSFEGGQLPEIFDADDNKKILSLSSRVTGTRCIPLGLSDGPSPYQEGQWGWASGRSLEDYNNWDDNEPDNGVASAPNEDFGFMYINPSVFVDGVNQRDAGRWNDAFDAGCYNAPTFAVCCRKTPPPPPTRPPSPPPPPGPRVRLSDGQRPR